MKRRVVFVFLAVLGVSFPMLGGCQTLTDTPGENAARVGHTMATDWHAVPDAAEHVMLLDRPIQLSQAPVPER